jgi:hypothetical protein
MHAKELATDGFAFNINRSDELKRLLATVSPHEQAA